METVLTYEEVGGHMAEVSGQCPNVHARGAGPAYSSQLRSPEVPHSLSAFFIRPRPMALYLLLPLTRGKKKEKDIYDFVLSRGHYSCD